MTNISLLTYDNDSYFRSKKEILNLSVESLYDSSSTNQEDVIIKFIKQMDKTKVDSGLLPPGLRLTIPGLIIFERPPSMQLVQYQNMTLEQMDNMEHGYEDEDEDCPEYDDTIHSYYIPVPWQLYIATYSTNPASMYRVTDVRMYFMNTPLNHPDVKLYAPYIPNFFADGHLCSPMFEDSYEVDRYPQDLSGVMASAFDWIWNTGFNADLIECIEQTIVQCKDKNPVVHNFLVEYHENKRYRYLSRHLAFYKYLSELSIHEITSLEWANPAYCSHFNNELRIVYNNDTAAVQQFKDSDRYDPDSRDELSDFKFWYGDLYAHDKTYSKIIESLFYWESMYGHNNHYSSILDPNSVLFNSFDYFASALNNQISYHKMNQA